MLGDSVSYCRVGSSDLVGMSHRTFDTKTTDAGLHCQSRNLDDFGLSSECQCHRVFSICTNDCISDSHVPDYDDQFILISSFSVVVCRPVISSEISVLSCISFI